MAEFEAKTAGQKCLAAGRRASPEVVCSTLTPLDVVSFISNGVENIFSPTTQASGFAAGPEFTPDVSSLAFLVYPRCKLTCLLSLPPMLAHLLFCRGSGVGGNRADYLDRFLVSSD